MGAGTKAGAHDVRCACGNLLALRTARGVEIKCRRCKRTVLVLPTDATAGRDPTPD